jgi:hypothetical protein
MYRTGILPRPDRKRPQPSCATFARVSASRFRGGTSLYRNLVHQTRSRSRQSRATHSASAPKRLCVGTSMCRIFVFLMRLRDHDRVQARRDEKPHIVVCGAIRVNSGACHSRCDARKKLYIVIPGAAVVSSPRQPDCGGRMPERTFAKRMARRASRRTRRVYPAVAAPEHNWIPDLAHPCGLVRNDEDTGGTPHKE